MYPLPAHLVVFLATFFAFRLSFAASPSYNTTTRLSWQCLPENIALFADLACSLGGPSYLVAEGAPSEHDASGRGPRHTAEYVPWSYEPVCTGAVEGIGSELCVYTSLEYAGGRGISIITVPGIAREFAALLPFTDSKALDGLLVSGNVRVTPKTESMGRNTIAKQDLKKGDEIASNVPIVVESLSSSTALSPPEREELLRAAVLRLPVATSRLLIRLTSEERPELLLSGFMDTHGGFQIDIGGHSHYSLFPELAYFNHACAPNSQVHTDTLTLRTSLRAARDIKKGKAITFSYFYPDDRQIHFKPFADRQRTTRLYFAFTCSCSRCRAGTRPDPALRQLHRTQRELEDWSPESHATPEDARALIRQYQWQGFDAFLDIPYRLAALEYNAVGDARQAQKYAGLAAEILTFNEMEAYPEFRTCRKLLHDPTRHWSWRRRIINQ